MDKVFDAQTLQFMSELSSELIKDELEHVKVQVYEHQGVCFSNGNVEKAILDIMPEWKARKDDVFIITYPKAGTTWAQEIMYLVLNGASFEKAQKAHTFIRVPYIELNMKPPKLQWLCHPLKSFLILWCMLKIMFQLLWYKTRMGKFSMPTPFEMIEMIPSPRFLKSHLPEHVLPSDIFKKKAKIVYVARNPKDVAVSFYHFHQYVPNLPKYDSWNQFFEDFMSGHVSYGRWYEHYLGYWKRRHEDNILFLKYEDMKRDERAAVKQICEFLGHHYPDDILDRITEHTTFKSMKKNPMTNPDSFSFRRDGKNHLSFMRKGEIGDWKNYFTEAQNEAFDALYEEKLAGTGLDFDFE